MNSQLIFSPPPPLPLAPPPLPPAIRTRSHKENREPIYTRLLLVLAAIYGSAGSSDVGRRAAGGSVSASRNLQAPPTFSLLLSFFFFLTIKLCLGATPPAPSVGPPTVMRLRLLDIKWSAVVRRVGLCGYVRIDRIGY